MKTNGYRVQVTREEEGDNTVLLDVAVEVPAEYAAGGRDEDQAAVPIPLQQQLRTALEAARPGIP